MTPPCPAPPAAAGPPAGTARLDATAAVPHPTRPPAPPPAAVVLCWFCGAVSHDPAAVGWVTVSPGWGRDPEVDSAHGVCPPCLAVRLTPPPSAAG